MKQLILLVILSTQYSLFTFCQNELSISYIHRTPEIDFVQNSQNPLVEGWPMVGQAITWEGKIKNWGNSNLNNIEYKWYLDNVEVASGTINIPANTEVNVNYNTTWSFSRKELKLVVDENNLVVEEEENNNEITIFTDAISVGFYVEQSVYDYFRQNQSSLNSASVCWEDWAHRQVGLWNNMFANAIYPSAPMGVLDRIRLDKITIVPDGALPLNGGVPSNNPNSNDKSVDLIWGFPASLILNNFYDNITEAVMTNPFYYEGSLIHELGHARYLVDLYGFNIDGGVPGERIEILENGEYVLDTEYMPFVVWDIPYLTPHTGFMNNANEVTISEFTVLAMNRIAGHRATQGNQNSPGNIGEFLDEIPSQNEVTLKDNLGNIIPNADVKIYQGSPLPGVWYGAKFDNLPDLNFTSNSDGKILLGSNPFSLTGNISHTYGFANGVIILRVENSGGVGYGFLDLPTFNLEYFRGNTTFASYELILENWIPNTTSNCPNELTDFTFLGEFENSKYFLSNDPANWTTAQSNANTQGGYLASINSQAENDFILGNINDIVFIGYNDAQVEGSFEWDSGEPVTFEALVENNVPNKDFAKMNFWNGNWGLDGEFVSRKYIVEIPCSTNPTGLQVNCDLNIDPNDLQVDESDPTGNIVNWTPPTATTDCPGGIVSIEQISGQPSGSFFTAWTISDHIVVYKITDACGNEEVCVTEFEVNGIYGGINCPSDIIVNATSADGAIVNFNPPTISPTTCIPGIPNQVSGAPSGSVFPIGTTEIQFVSFFAGSNTYCQNGISCSFTITVNPMNTGGGCPEDFSGFTTLGEFGDSKYYISNDVSRPMDAQTVAESNGGYLVTISSQEENDFIQQNISDMVYIGLNDYDSEGNLEWFNGEDFTFDNINPCGFCNENSDDQDFVIMAPWNGEWSFSNFYNNRKYIMEIPCGGGTGGDLPDLTISNLANMANSGMAGEVVFFNFDLNNVGTITANGDYNVNMYISTDEIFSGDDILVGEVPTGDTPVGTIANVPGAITVPNLSDGNYFLIIFADALEEIEESDEINNTLTTTFEITSDGGGGCPTSLAGYTALGEFNGSAYFLSEDISRPIDAQALAESHGGYLATISSQAENDFIQQGISEMVYIGLNDYNSEGNLEWFSGEPFTFNNIDPCNFCNENSDDQDFVIMAPWNGEWSFSNFWNQRKYIVEIPCSSTLTDPNMNNAFVIQNLDQESLDRLMIKKVFPNPAMDFIYTTISSPMEQEVEVQIFDARGILMKNITILLQEGENVNHISISDLPGGFYSAFVLNAQGKNATKRFVKVRD